MDRGDAVEQLRAAGCVYAEDEAQLFAEATRKVAEYDDLVRRRCAGERMEHLLGWAAFDNTKIVVTSGVFVPRRRSELLVRIAADSAPLGGIVADMCCGSGAIAAAVAGRRPDLTVYATDVDPAATACAARNIDSEHVFTGDLFDGLPRHLAGRLNVVIANAPYVPSDALDFMPVDARDNEPRITLDGGSDGMDVQRRIVEQAPVWLAPRGILVMETSRDQQAAGMEMLRAAGLTARADTEDQIDAFAIVGERH